MLPTTWFQPTILLVLTPNINNDFSPQELHYFPLSLRRLAKYNRAITFFWHQVLMRATLPLQQIISLSMGITVGKTCAQGNATPLTNQSLQELSLLTPMASPLMGLNLLVQVA